VTNRNRILVETKNGKLEGSVQGGLLSFKGIPYAEAPVGSLRWLPPQPKRDWQGVRQATDFANIAPQNETRLPMMREFVAVERQSENCLFLNVFTPSLEGRRPVMVWIHGGAFSMGSSSQLTYREGRLALNRKVVLVTINYRLGLLGFLNLNEVTGGKIPATGNEGLLDQVAALEWVKKNISNFGGDPNNVTVFGESAGGMSVAAVMVLPLAQGLFHKAIIESAVGDIARPLKPSVRAAEQWLKIVEISPSNPSALRKLSIKKLLASQMELALKMGTGLAPAMPVADGEVMPLMPLDAFTQGRAAKIPALIGTNLDEQKLFAAMLPNAGRVDDAGLIRRLQKMVTPESVGALVETYRTARTGRGEDASAAEIMSAINTDSMFRHTALLLLDAQCQFGQPVYNYLFTWKSPAMGGSLGACHALEVGFIFGTHEKYFCGEGPAADRLSSEMQDAWSSFAYNGDPSCPSLGQWPQYCMGRKTMILGEKSHVEAAPYESERAVWAKVKPLQPSAQP
jgi:para-nitrobenzyl esterase